MLPDISYFLYRNSFYLNELMELTSLGEENAKKLQLAIKKDAVNGLLRFSNNISYEMLPDIQYRILKKFVLEYEKRLIGNLN